MRRFRRYPPWSVWVCAALACAVAGRYWWQRGGSVSPHAALGSSLSVSLTPGEFEVVRIEHADLLVVRQQVPVPGKSGGQEFEAKLQLLGVKLPVEDSPTELIESSRQFTADLLASGIPTLELDRRRLNSQGHFLAYVYVGDKLLNEELVRAGLARVDIYPGDNQTMHRAFVKAEKEARRAGRGIWRHASE